MSTHEHDAGVASVPSQTVTPPVDSVVEPIWQRYWGRISLLLLVSLALFSGLSWVVLPIWGIVALWGLVLGVVGIGYYRRWRHRQWAQQKAEVQRKMDSLIGGLDLSLEAD